MTDRILEIAERPARLRAENGLLVVDFLADPVTKAPADPDGPTARHRCERVGESDRLTIPFAELAVVLIAHPRVLLTQAVLSELAGAGAMLVACDRRHMPAGMLLPLQTHFLQSYRYATQAALAKPARKRLWQHIVRAKIRAQAELLRQKTGSDQGLQALAHRVRSGDPDNLEAVASRRYWSLLLPEFHRDPERGGANACLNYGYAVLRAATARALCAAGLHPSLGIHHHNRYNPFCLADDLMEPFRPLVDSVVADLAQRTPAVELDRQTKAVILGELTGRFVAEGESRSLFDWLAQAAQSLATAIEQGTAEGLFLPLLQPQPRTQE